LTIWILSLHTLITSNKNKFYISIYLPHLTCFQPSLCKKLTASIVPHSFHFMSIILKGAFAVGTTDTICGRSLSSKFPVDINFETVYVTRPTWHKCHIPCGHVCQILSSKSNCETMHVSLIFPPRDNRGQNNEQSECLLRPQLFIPTVPV